MEYSYRDVIDLKEKPLKLHLRYLIAVLKGNKKALFVIITVIYNGAAGVEFVCNLVEIRIVIRLLILKYRQMYRQ